MSPTHIRRLLARILPAAIIALAWAPPVSAQTPAATVLVIDGSAAMTGVDEEQQLRIESVRQATYAVTSRLPESTRMGAVTYGTTIANYADNKTEGCKDTTVLANVSDTSPLGISSTVSTIYPGGFAPLTAAVTKAQALLKGQDEANIVVISSAADPCSPTPVCEAAKKFKDNYPAVRIHTIGFMAEDEANRDLACLAAATGGTYRQATTAATLATALNEAMTGTIPTTDLPVVTPASKLEAPLLETGTVDAPIRARLIGPFTKGTTGYVKVSVPEDHILQVALNDPTGNTEGYSMPIALVTGSGEVCHATTKPLDASGGYLLSLPTGESGANCTHEDLFLAIAGSHGAPAQLDLAITAIATEDLEDAEAPAARTAAELAPGAATAGETITLSPNMAGAAPTTGGTFETQLLPGQNGYLAATTAWGQAIDVQVEVLEAPADPNIWNPVPTIGRPLHLEITNALGQPQELVGDTTLDTLAVGSPITFGTAHPATLTNGATTTSWQAGTQYLRIGVPADADTGLLGTYAVADQFQPVNLRITITPVGEAAAPPSPTEISAADGGKITSGLMTALMTVGAAAFLVTIVVGVGLLLSNKRPRKKQRWAERF